MAQPGGDPRLAQRALPEDVPVLVRHRPGDADLLDRDLALEAQIAGPPHGSHGAVPDRILELVAPSDHASRPGHWQHGRDITPFGRPLPVSWIRIRPVSPLSGR